MMMIMITIMIMMNDNNDNNDNNDKNKRQMRPHERLPYTRDHVYIYGNSSLLTAAYVPGT